MLDFSDYMELSDGVFSSPILYTQYARVQCTTELLLYTFGPPSSFLPKD